MKGEQQFCECGNGLLIVRIEEGMIGLECLECKEEFHLMTMQKQVVRRIKFASEEKKE